MGELTPNLLDLDRFAVGTTLVNLGEESGRDWGAIRQDVRRSVNKLLQQKTGRRPMVVPVIMEI